MIRILPLTPVVAALILTGCGSAPDPDTNAASLNEVAASAVAANSTTPQQNAAAPANPQQAPDDVLTLEGLGNLRIGQPVPADSGFAERGAQVSATCRTVSSAEFPGVYAIVSDGQVRRITVGQRSDVKLIEGIGVGAPEKTVKDAFPGFREAPHKYVEAPAKYLTAPGVSERNPGLRFEIGRDGKVSLMHVGLMPELGYVEGCA